MTILRSPFTVLLSVVMLLMVAGCGSAASSANNPTPAVKAPAPPATPGAVGSPTTAVKSTPAPQPTAQATPVVTGGNVAAVINGHTVPMSKFHVLANLAASQAAQSTSTPPTVSQITTEAMTQIIDDELVRQYAVKHHIAVTKSDVQAQLSQQISSVGSKAALDARLAQVGVSESQFTMLITAYILGAKVENAVAPIPTKKVPTLVASVRHILIALKPTGKPVRTYPQALAIAKEVFAKLKHGASFASLVTKYSDDPGSLKTGGVYSNVTKGQMVPSFDKATFTDPLHHPRIIKSQFGYHIIEVLSRGTKLISSTSTQAQQQAAQSAQSQTFSKWIAKQKKAATIQKFAKVEKA